MRGNYTASLVIIFAIALSFSTLPGPLAATVHFPHVPYAHASPAPATSWLPAGPSTNTQIQAIFASDLAEQTALLAETVDLTDVPLTPTMAQCLSQTGTVCPQIPGANPSHFAVTSPLSTHDIFEIQVMLHNNYWGIPMNYGLDAGCTIPAGVGAGVNDAACPGVSIRQAVAHLIDKVQYCASNGIVVCSAVDNDSPITSGLLTADPCGWDALFPQTGPNCIVGGAAGTAYHLSPTTAIGHDTGGTAATYSWEPATDNGGKADLCAAAQHLVTAGVASGFDTATCVLTGISVNAAAHPVNIFARTDRPARLALGDGLFQDLCYLFTGHWTDGACQVVATTTTGCSGTCYVTDTRGTFTQFQGFTTSNIGINDNWWLYTGGFGSVFPFDSLLYGEFNSQGVSGGAWDQPPCSSLATPSTSPPNYEYACVPAYDTISSQMEFSPCLTAPGDPTPAQTHLTVTFGDCSGTSKLSAQSAGYQTEDLYGKLELFIPIYSPSVQFGYLAKWNNVINSQSSGVANLFTWLDAYDSVTHSTTLTQGFAAPTKSLNPYAASSVFDFQTIGNVYDSLGSLNPAQSGEYFDYLTSGHSTPCNTNLSIPCDLAHLGYTPPSGTIGTLRFSLRPDIFWQSDTSGAHPARPLTSWDVKFTYFTLPSCPFQGGLCFSSIIDIHVLDKANFDINLNTIGPFTLIGPFGVPSLTIVPGRYWSSTCSGATWDNDVNAGSVPTSCMAVTSQMSTITFDPLSSTPNNGVSPGILIGSGPFECQSSSGVVGTGCSSTGTQNPPPGGSYTLTRFGCNRATGTCNAPGANPTSTYFRSDGNLALAIWAGTNGDSTHDLITISSVAFCFNKPVGTPSCAQWQRGIGNPGTGTIVNVSQVSAVIRFSQDGNWVSPFNWLPGIPLACCPFMSSPPVGIQSAPPVLVEGTNTLSPCSIDPVNGYDC